jgi:hypothetical protein
MKVRLSGLLAAILGFTITTASGARSSTVQTIDSELCTVVHDGKTLYCGFVGGTWLGAGAAVAYVDGYSSADKTILLDLIRYSYTGTRTESAAVNSIGTGSYDTALTATQMATNPSEWDYYLFYIDGWPNVIDGAANSIYGVSMISR